MRRRFSPILTFAWRDAANAFSKTITLPDSLDSSSSRCHTSFLSQYTFYYQDAREAANKPSRGLHSLDAAHHECIVDASFFETPQLQ